MEASLAYAAGKPFLSDEQFDELKRKLRKQNSRVVQQVRTLPHLGIRFKGVEIWVESLHRIWVFSQWSEAEFHLQ